MAEATTRTLFIQYQCTGFERNGGCGHRFNVEYDGDSKRNPGVPAAGQQTQISCQFPKFERTDAYARDRGITVGGMFSVLCPECGQQASPTKKAIRAMMGNEDCGPDCIDATGDVCKCRCGGANHGIRGLA